MGHGEDQIWLYLNLSKGIVENKPIDIFNNGEMKRDFTYVSDLVYAILLLLKCYPRKE